jgi:hypothetical protein
MSNEQLNKYKELYSQLVSHFVDLHNYHHTFINSPSSKNGVDTRKSIKRMIDIEKKMRQLSATVSREHRKNVKDGIRAEKKELARIKSLPKKRGRPPTKGKTNVINTTN